MPLAIEHNEQTMIRDARVLQPQFIPDEVEHRNPEVNQLSNTLKPIMDGQSGEPSLLLGPSGAGKTCIAQYTVERLRENVLDINTQYFNCWQDHTRFQVLYRILECLDRTVNIHRRSTPKDELLDRIRDYDGPEVVVILDELVSILAARAQWGLSEHTIGNEELELIADAAAGDARIAISILRNASGYVEQHGCDRITPEIVRDAMPEGRDDVRQKTLDQRNAYQRALYETR